VTKVFALDLSLSTGWAVGNASGSSVVYGTKRLPSTGKHLGPTIDTLICFVDGMIRQHKPALLVFESPYIAKAYDAPMLRRMFGMHVAVEWAAHRVSLECAEATPSEWRRTFFGRYFEIKMKRDAAKAMAIKQCQMRDWNPQDDNAADALGLMDHALGKLDDAYFKWSMTRSMRPLP
jgi:hypothetical protein